MGEKETNACNDGQVLNVIEAIMALNRLGIGTIEVAHSFFPAKFTAKCKLHTFSRFRIIYITLVETHLHAMHTPLKCCSTS